MRVIGGPFSRVNTTEYRNALHKCFPENTQWFISGRSALYAIIKEIQNKTTNRKILAPSFYCGSVVDILMSAGFEVSFYDVSASADYGIRRKIHIIDEGTVILSDYYGFYDDHLETTAIQLHKQGIIIIRDISRSLLSICRKNYVDYTFCSVRKWTGTKTGGFALGLRKSAEEQPFKTDTELQSIFSSFLPDYSRYLYTGEGDRSYFSDMFWKCEQRFAFSYDGYIMDKDDYNRLPIWNVDEVIEKRRENADYIINCLSHSGRLIYNKLSPNDVPFFVPILFEDAEQREYICQELDRNNIFCSMPWTTISKDMKPCSLSDRGLELVCDDRYDPRDLERMIDIINSYI